MRVFLASSSPARLMLLRSGGIEPKIIVSDVDEEQKINEEETKTGRKFHPKEHVLFLARLKAEAIIDQVKIDLKNNSEQDALIIGGDSMFFFANKTYGKPHSIESAKNRWRNFIGKNGVLYSGQYLIRINLANNEIKSIGSVSDARVFFASDLTENECNAYINTGEPLEVAGAFTLDSLGSAFIEKIEGHPSTVIGLSLPELRKMCISLDVAWTDLWSKSRTNGIV